MSKDKEYMLDALKIHELEFDLENCATDDNRDIYSYSLEEVLKEARYVLSNFYEGGHTFNEDLNSDDEDTRRDAENEVKQLEAFIKKYSKSSNTKKKRKITTLTEEQKNFFLDIKQGDKILLNDGDIAEFVKLNRTRFTGKINGEEYYIPVSMMIKKVD